MHVEDYDFHDFIAVAKSIFNVSPWFILYQISLVLLQVNCVYICSMNVFDVLGVEADLVATQNVINSDKITVICDTLSESYLLASPIVGGPPYIRFFASAPLIFDNETIGSISIADSSPRRLFNMSDLGILQSLADAVVNTIMERYQTQIRFKDVVKNLLQHKVQTIQPSVKSIQDVLYSIREVKDEISMTLKSEHKNQNSHYADKVSSSTDDIIHSARSLSMYVDGNLTLCQAFEKEKFKIAVPCNVLDTISETRDEISETYRERSMWWMVDRTTLESGSHISHPNVIKEILLSTVQTHSAVGNSLSISIRFEIMLQPSQSSNWLYESLLTGRLIIRVESHGRRRHSSPSDPFAHRTDRVPEMTPPSTVSHELSDITENIRNMLTEVGGEYSKLDVEDKYSSRKNAEYVFYIPCCICVHDNVLKVGDSKSRYGAGTELFSKTNHSLDQNPSHCMMMKSSNSEPQCFGESLCDDGSEYPLILLENDVEIRSPVARRHSSGHRTTTPSNHRDETAEVTMNSDSHVKTKESSKSSAPPIVRDIDSNAQEKEMPPSIRVSSTATRESRSRLPAWTTPRNTAAINVLVADDSNTVQNSMILWLESQGCAVHCVNDGAKALQQLQSDVYDLAFIGLDMVGYLYLELFQSHSYLISPSHHVLIVWNDWYGLLASYHEYQHIRLRQQRCANNWYFREE